jgi:hypothetical protein
METISDNKPVSKLKNKVLFLGNGINSLNNKETWENLIDDLRKTVGSKKELEDLKNNFPLIFEKLLFHGIKNKNISSEDDLKTKKSTPDLKVEVSPFL